MNCPNFLGSALWPALQAKNVSIRYQDAIRSVLGGDLNLVGSRQAATLNGRVLIDSSSFTKNFDLATFAGQVQSGSESAPSEGMANKTKLDIATNCSRPEPYQQRRKPAGASAGPLA